MPLAFLLSQITKLIFIGKLLFLECEIRLFKFDPWPEIKTQVFFLPF